MRRERWLAALLPMVIGASFAACDWDPGKAFDRKDPEVERARGEYSRSFVDGGDADLPSAELALEEVLRFHCTTIDASNDLLDKRGNAGLDLGLVVFRIAELLGHRFGDEEIDAGAEEREREVTARTPYLDCAKLLLGKIADEPSTPRSLALRARYLMGNVAFLGRHYREAVDEYDRVLLAHPARGADVADAAPEDEDAIARDAAWNRAIALRRIEDQDAGNDADARDDAPSDANDDGASDGGDSGGDAGDSGSDGGDSGGGDAGDSGGDSGDSGGGDASDSGGDGGRDGGADGGSDTGGQHDASPSPSPSQSASPASSGAFDVRELDRFDKKKPLDLDLQQKVRERGRVPKELDK
jgi:hypothetical protein